MVPEKAVYEIQGHSFKLRPTTPKVRNELEEIVKNADIQSRINRRELEKSIMDPDYVMVDYVERDPYLLFFEIFCIITEGPHDKIVFEDFDVKITELALENFGLSVSETAIRLAMLSS